MSSNKIMKRVTNVFEPFYGISGRYSGVFSNTVNTHDLNNKVDGK